MGGQFGILANQGSASDDGLYSRQLKQLLYKVSLGSVDVAAEPTIMATLRVVLAIFRKRPFEYYTLKDWKLQPNSRMEP